MSNSQKARPPSPTKVSRGSICEIRTILTIFTVLLLALFIGNLAITPSPKMPDVDLEKWWGPYPIDMKSDTSVRPYTIDFPDMIINDLKERLLHRRPFTPPMDTSGKYGFNTDFMTRVLDFWQNNYKFKEREVFLNKYPHYMTNIQGLDVHFIHVKPKITTETLSVIPILLIHNWPSSVCEFYDIIPMLTTSEPGRDFVFEVIVPSLPGFGFSQAPTRPGMGPINMAGILHNLMSRIGHSKYYIHGGDFGQSVGSAMATLFQNNVLGFHTNMPVITVNPFLFVTKAFGLYVWYQLTDPQPNNNLDLASNVKLYLENSGYINVPDKPDTTGIALSESPAGLASYILERFSISTRIDDRNASDGGLLNKYSLTKLLDNIMVYWTTNTFTTSARARMENTDMFIIDQIPTYTPTWAIKFKHETVSPDFLLQTKYQKYFQSTVVDVAAHYPAMEHPEILAEDLYNAVTAFRKEYKGQSQPQQEVKPTPKTEAKQTHKQEAKVTLNAEAKKTVYDFIVKDINGNEVSLEKYRGKVLIIVNVASQCGYTDTHYKELNELYDKYEEKGLGILAFPCNQFGGQEPGPLKEILQFTQKRNVRFDIFEKINVNGENTHPLWSFLKSVQSGTFGDFIKWNFSKFIIDRNGVPVERFGPNVSPMELESYLNKYW